MNLEQISILGSGRSDGSVTTCSCAISDLLLLFSRLKNLETAHKGVINTHHSTSIIEFTAVVGSREEGDQLSLCEKLIAVFNDLMSTANKVNVVLLIKS